MISFAVSVTLRAVWAPSLVMVSGSVSVTVSASVSVADADSVLITFRFESRSCSRYATDSVTVRYRPRVCYR